MPTQNTTTHPLHTARDEKIAAIKAEDAVIAGVFGRKDAASRKTRLSAGARKANRMAEIGQIELDMTLEGVEYEPYRPTRLVATRLEPMTQAELETKLAAVRKLAADPANMDNATLQHQAEIRIRGLLKSAEARGYKVA